MIIYSRTRNEFLGENSIALADALEAKIFEEIGSETSTEEKRSWISSIDALKRLFSNASIPSDCGISLEYNLPHTNNRIDCIVSGINEQNILQAVIIEMKGWRSALLTDMKEIVQTRLGKKDECNPSGMKFTSHPSSQALWYADYLYDFKEIVQDGKLQAVPCAYLYNCESNDVIHNDFYNDVTSVAPPFCKNEETDLLKFINTRITKGDKCEAIQRLEESRIRASKRLVDSIESMCTGTEFFRLSPQQKEAITRIKRAIQWQEANLDKKVVIVVPGGPGTGKSVIAINLVFQLITEATKKNQETSVKYVTKTRAPRALLHDVMVDSKPTRKILGSVLSGADVRNLHVAVIDEAHKLALGRSGNQLDKIIANNDIIVMFQDEKQRVSVQDVGTLENIRKYANKNNAVFTIMEPLETQFRCGITSWVEYALQYPEAKTINLPSERDFDFRIYDTPGELYEDIQKIDSAENPARVVAGYTREWISRKADHTADTDWFLKKADGAVIKAQWNMMDTKDINKASEKTDNWITQQSAEKIGCIHTCQGMEAAYVGVIVGKDIQLGADGRIEFHPECHAMDDPVGIPARLCKPMEQLNLESQALVTELLRNTYYVLMSRGMKGCFLYFEDEKLRDYFKKLSAKRMK